MLSNRLLRGTWVLALVATVAVGCSSRGSGGGGGSASPGSTATGSFTQVTPLATARSDHTATLTLNGASVVVAGGKHADAAGQLGVSDTIEVYNPQTGRWAMASSRMASPRMRHVATLLGNGIVFLAGGQSDLAGAQVLNSIDLYNPLTGQITRSNATLSTARTDAVAIAFQANQINYVLVAGGRGSSGQVLDSADLYNADADVITPISGRMAAAQAGANAILLAGGRILIQGGSDGTGRPTSFQIFDTATLSFGASGSMLLNRSDDALVQSGNDILVAGGRDANAADVASGELYDAGTGAFTAATGALLTPRSGMTATVIGNTAVFIGGRSANTLVLASENYVGGRFGSGPSLNTGRIKHTATALANNFILVVGGEDLVGRPMASSEVLAPRGATVPGAVGSTPATGPIPTIASLNPTTGPVGTTVTVTGTNYDAVPGNNIVRLNGVGMPVQSVNTASASHTLTVVVPSGATSGNITVEVLGRVSNGSPFTVGTGGGGTGGNPSGAQGPIRIWLVFPTTLSRTTLYIAGTPVSITGTGFTRYAIPYFGGVPSMSLVSFNLSNIPLIGSISELVTVTPSTAPAGAQQLWLEDNGYISNRFTVTIQ